MKKFILFTLLILSNLSQLYSQELNVKVSGKGPKIIFIPGLASSGEVWDQAVTQLSKNYECHVITLPGFGTNPPTEIQDGFFKTMEGLISDYIVTQNEQVTLIGHSLGGFISLKLSRSHPKQIKRTIIVDSYPFYSAALNPSATEESMAGMATQAKEMMISQSEEQYQTQQKMTMAMMTTSSEKIPILVDWSMQSDRATIAQAFYELMTSDFRDELADVNTPILVLGAWASGKDYGMTEESVKQAFSNQYKLAKNVQIRMAPTAYHFIMWDNPDWFLENVTEFLK
ncbi:alpha/beta hydrolase [Algoriphagus lacus]|uniref:Alpha/beta hydrolase n=1 Tax=Algoriphagus lacus TaxID=2056311 RepID=A0A418PNU2_9BACT|nr:alpha/beta hydrolase [Algoriphagus lacus]RIW13341.1 alpha/beta hydrolase [Algoriphagus lacus]